MALGEEVADAYISIHGDTTAFKADLKKLELTSKRLMSQIGEDAGKELGDGVDREFTRAVKGKGTKAINVSFLGKLKGSRNNFLNIVGSMGKGLEDLISKTVTNTFTAAGKVTSFLGGKLLNIGEGAGSLQGPLNALGANLVKAGEGMGAISSTGIGLVIVLGVLVGSFFAVGAAVALLTTLLSSLLAIAVALAGSAFFALAGVVLALGPAALAAAAGVGALVAAFAGMDEETKKAFDPLMAALKELQKNVRGALFTNLKNQLRDIKDLLNTFIAPLLVAAAGALSAVFDQFLAGLQSPAVKATLDIFTATLPTILANMGSALSDFLLGILNFFGPIAEAMVPLSDGIADIAESFRLWTEKPENMQAISQFFADAVESTKIWAGLIPPLSAAILGLFQQGKDTGDSFVQKIVEIISKFAEWVNSREGRQEIQDWFTNAREVAGQLADIIGKVSEAIAKLDTPENREALQTLLGWITNVADAINTVNDLFKDLPGLIAGVKAVAFQIPGLGQALTLLEKIIQGITWITRNSGAATKTFGAGLPGGGRALQQRRGGILNSPTHILAGEAGREMVVPLVRPLSQVDPSVRAVSAFARGMDASSFNSGFGNNNPGGKVVNINSGAVQVNAPTGDGQQIANAVLDRLVARWK